MHNILLHLICAHVTSNVSSINNHTSPSPSSFTRGASKLMAGSSGTGAKSAGNVGIGFEALLLFSLVRPLPPPQPPEPSPPSRLSSSRGLGLLLLETRRAKSRSPPVATRQHYNPPPAAPPTGAARRHDGGDRDSCCCLRYQVGGSGDSSIFLLLFESEKWNTN